MKSSQDFLRDALRTAGELEVERLDDGWYVLGEGLALPVLSKEEGEAFVEEYNTKWMIPKNHTR